MRKPAGVFVLVAGLFLTAFHVERIVEGSSASADGPSWGQTPSVGVEVASPVECAEGSEVGEGDAVHRGVDGGWLRGAMVPVFHLRATHARSSERSRVPAVSHGRSPPC